MKNFNLLRKSERKSVGTTLALTVGSPSFDRRGTMLKHYALMLLFLLGSLNVWGADVTYVFKTATDNPGNAKNWFTDDIDAYSNWSATKGGTNDPKYYGTGEGLRVYNGGTFTITSTKTLASVTLTFSGTSYTFSSSNTDNPQIVEPNATSYEWSVGRTCRLQKIEITYASGSGSSNPTVSAEPNKVEFGTKNIYGGANTTGNIDVAVTGSHLTGNITATLSGDDAEKFSISGAPFAPTAGSASGTLVVSYEVTEATIVR